MAMQHDEQGFLLGQKVDRDNLLTALGDIVDELKVISRKLDGDVGAPVKAGLESAKATSDALPYTPPIDKSTAPKDPSGSDNSGRFVGAKTPGSQAANSVQETPSDIKVVVERDEAPAGRPGAPEKPIIATPVMANKDSQSTPTVAVPLPGKGVGRNSPEQSPGETAAGSQDSGTVRAESPEMKVTIEHEAAPRQGPGDTPIVATPEAGKSSGRDSSGRFVGAKTPDDEQSNEDEGSAEGSLGTAIGGLSDRLTGAIGSMAVNEESDPAVKAFREVAQPLSRGFGKILGSKGDSGQDRWYRRFWRNMRGTAKREKKHEARVLEQLEDIEQAQGGGKSGSFLGLLFRPILTALGGILAALLPLGLLSKIAGALGLKGLAAKIAPGARTRGPATRAPGAGGPGVSGAPGSRGAAGANAGGPARGGMWSAVRRGGGRILQGAGKLAKRIPLLGTLLSAGLAAKDVYSSESSDMTRKDKDKATGSAVGRGVGGIGGVFAGAAAGAAMGSVVPIIGTAIGGLVGAAVGGWLGESAGDVIGDKMGEWVGDLRDSDIGGSIISAWNTTTDFASHLWGQASSSIEDKWSAVTGKVSETWASIAGVFSGAWDGIAGAITSKWDAVTDSISAGWESALGGMSEAWGKVTGLAEQWWGSVKDTANKANDWVKEKTGVDIAETVSTAGQLVSDTYTGAKDKAGEVITGAKGKIADAGSWLVNSLKKAASTAYEATGVKAGVDAVRKSADHAKGKQALRQAMADSGIVDPTEQASFMGQMDHESAGFTQVEESLNYSPERFLEMFGDRAGISTTEEAGAILAQGDGATGEAMYGGEWGRKNLGNTEEGDGHRFRGRGYTQLTGRDNYTAAGDALGVDLANNPDMAADPDIAAKIATWYWKSKPGVREAAQAGDTEAVTRKINGGTNGLEDRIALTKEYLPEAQSGELNAAPTPASTPQQQVAVTAPEPKDKKSEPEPQVAAVTAQAEKGRDYPSTGNAATDKKIAKARARAAAMKDRYKERQQSPEAASQSAKDAAVQQGSEAMPVTWTAQGSGAPKNSVSASATPKAVKVPSAKSVAVADQPSVSTPMGDKKASGGGREREQRDVSRNISDGRIAHIVTGAYSGMG